ncbi:MAG: hypothetical protein GTO81_37660 [Candidatus Aminicenantes bacterium]|nr:hypothetical protein [Candidatus Aminicenantes bacterium]NIM84405.1 hypothetical protein [Candidatus Aminicenantes bacterium]
MIRQRKKTQYTYCPMCKHPGHISDKYFVEWNEKKKEFRVTVALFCWPCNFRWNEKSLKTLPLDIALESRCSCGAQLSIGNYSIKRVRDEIEFRGTYYCEICKKNTSTIVSKLASAIAGIWSNVEKIVISPDGLSIDSDRGVVFISYAFEDIEIVEKEIVSTLNAQCPFGKRA